MYNSRSSQGHLCKVYFWSYSAPPLAPGRFCSWWFQIDNTIRLKVCGGGRGERRREGREGREGREEKGGIGGALKNLYSTFPLKRASSILSHCCSNFRGRPDPSSHGDRKGSCLFPMPSHLRTSPEVSWTTAVLVSGLL